jgi:glycosyltransferase involved in cell wall biosynthesis
MRILLAVHGYPPTHCSGAERQAARMAEWLKAHGHDAEVFAIEDLHADKTAVVSRPHDGVLVHRLSFELDDVHSSIGRRYDHPRIGAAFASVIDRRPAFDLVHIVSGYWLGNQVIRAAHARGLPLMLSLMEFWFMCFQINLMQPTGVLCSGPDSDAKCARCVLELSRRYRLPSKLAPPLMAIAWTLVRWMPENRLLEAELGRRRRALREALSFCDQVICNSRFLIDKFAAAGFDTLKFHYLRQGLPDADLQPEPRPIRGRELRLGYLGQVKFHKGVDLLVDAVTDLLRSGAPVTLDIWGSTQEEPAYVSDLRARTRSLEAIRWRGSYTGGARTVLRELDVVVVPSRWNENSPNVILEAYNGGLPVVATNLGGMAELVEHDRSGLLFDNNDRADLRAQLARLVWERGLCDRLRAGVPPVRSLDDEMNDVHALYQKMLRPAASHPASEGARRPLV